MRYKAVMKGNDELAGAKAAGMEAVCAEWYTNLYPNRRGEIGGVMTAGVPAELLKIWNHKEEKFRNSC